MQRWRGNFLCPTEWGWCIEDDSSTPITTTADPVSENLLKLIFFSTAKKYVCQLVAAEKQVVYCRLVNFHCYYLIVHRTAREHTPVFFLRYLKLYEHSISCITFFFPGVECNEFVVDVSTFLISMHSHRYILWQKRMTMKKMWTIRFPKNMRLMIELDDDDEDENDDDNDI